MKTLTGFCIISWAALCLILFPPHTSILSAAIPGQQAGLITCSSDDMRRNFCSADVSGGVQLVRQRSDAACIFNRTWGFEYGRGIWVDRGCRADFQLGGSGFNGWENGYNIYCASDDMGRNLCPTDTRGGVQIVRQRSDARCEYGRTWGYDRRGIWVDRGCRADFQIGGGYGNPGYGGGPGGWQPGGGSVQVVTCSSNDMHRRECEANIRGRSVRLIRQRSESDCIYGRTWGYGKKHIWVDRGCRADFEIGDIPD